MDTIYALATARGKAGVAVIRISGPQATNGLLSLVGSFAAPRIAALRLLKIDSEVVDQALVLRFDADASFTGEDVVELQLHGSQAIVNRILTHLATLATFRLAEPGEFTRRALQNGRLDLSQVEGLADLIEAETESQRRQAMRVFSGALGQKAEAWRQNILRAAALMEAVIDFADEDVPVDVRPEVLALIDGILVDLKAETAGFSAAERIRDGFEVAIIGAPNAGKSTLLNRLAGRQAALTSEFAGTTRDIIEVRMDLDGLAVTLLDTAGLRNALDPVEAMGVARALERADQADLRIFLLGGDASDSSYAPKGSDLVVQGKADIQEGLGLAVSGRTGEGVDRLIEEVTRILHQKSGSASTITRIRHRVAILAAVRALESAREMVLTGSYGEEFVAETLRSAILDMDELVGRIGVEDLLGEIFSSFCIGK